jgi:DNA-directed RNA polymerase specialized sigma24 family protein|tara:strand:- start:109 stop:711 length:603 start_codon:yes stop_codon:yes gene_type:complete
MNKLKQLEDNVLISHIKNQSNTEECLSELVNRHSGLCISMINGYVSSKDNESLRLELIKEKEYQIYNSALKFDPLKGSKFSTYLGNEIKWKCLNIYNKNKKRKTIQVEENLINYLNYHNQEEKSVDNSEIFGNIIQQAKSHSDPRVFEIFTLRYVEGKNNSVMPWKNISSKLKMSIQGCINIHDLALKQFSTKIKREINQ